MVFFIGELPITIFNLNRDELFQAAQMQSAWKNDPIATINHLLTEARKMGHNIDGLDSGSTLDMNAINRTIEEKLNPITQQHSQQQQAVQQQQEIQQQVTQFNNTHEHASIHGAHIAKLMTQCNMDASAAYWKLKDQARSLGLDFTQPLEAQAQQRLQGNTPSTTQVPSVPGVGDLRGGTPASNLQSQTHTQTNSASPFRDIIREAMAEANYK